MPTGPLQLQPAQRALLEEFERRYERWRGAREAAELAESALEAAWPGAPDAAQVQRALELRAEATQLQHEAMQMLRDAPI